MRSKRCAVQNQGITLNHYMISLTDRPLHLSLQHLSQPLFALSRYAPYNVKGRRLTTLLPPPPTPPKRGGKERREGDYQHSVIP